MDNTRIRKIKKGDKREFKAFYEEYVHKALGVAVNISKNKEIAKEAVQETFIRVFKHIERFDQSKAFDPWFYQILINEVNRLLSRESKVTHLTRPIDELEEFASKETEYYGELKEAISLLPDKYRIPIILKYLKGFSEKEVAEVLEENQNTIKTRLKKGKELLRYALEENARGSHHV